MDQRKQRRDNLYAVPSPPMPSAHALADNLGNFLRVLATAVEALCLPQLFCQFLGSKYVGKGGGLGNLTQAEHDAIFGHAGEDIDSHRRVSGGLCCQ